jgi:hypothetical protein
MFENEERSLRARAGNPARLSSTKDKTKKRIILTPMRKNPNRWDARVAITNGKMLLAIPFVRFHCLCIQYCFVSYYELL